MGRKKLDENDANERRKMQQVICQMIKERRPELNHSEFEDLLLIANSVKDGAMFRKIARGKQLISRLKINQMINECEKANIFTEQELLTEMESFFEKRDDAMIKTQLNDFFEQLDVMTALVLNGTVNVQDVFIKKMTETINKVKGTV